MMHRVNRLDNCHDLLVKNNSLGGSQQTAATITESSMSSGRSDTIIDGRHRVPVSIHVDQQQQQSALFSTVVTPLMSSATTTTTTSTISSECCGAASVALLETKYKDALARIQALEKKNAQLQAQQVEVQAAKELYLKVFEDFPALIWRSGLDKMCDYFNRTWLEWTGKTMEEEVGIGWANGVHPEDFDECLKIYTTAFDAREPFCMEYRLCDKYGQYRWIRDHGRPFYDLDDETFLGYIGSCYDITENKNNEHRMATLNKSKDKLVGLVTRDLRSPVDSVKTMAEFLQDNHGHIDASELAEITAQMRGDAGRTLDILDNLVKWTSAQHPQMMGSNSNNNTVDDGSALFKPQSVMSQDLFNELLSQVNLCAKAKKIRVQAGTRFGGRTNDDDGDETMGQQNQQENVMLVADKDMIITVLRNLVMNSIKFTYPGGYIQLIAQKLDGETVLLSVADTGVGMDEAIRRKLFDGAPPRRGTGNELGKGMGLVLCRNYVEQHQGTIWAADGPPDKGTCIQMTLPATMAQFKKAAQKQEKGESNSIYFKLGGGDQSTVALGSLDGSPLPFPCGA